MPTLGRRRAYGQHFLRDTEISRTISQEAFKFAQEHGARALFEIGPGKGALTEPLLELRRHGSEPLPLLLCEKDRAFADQWIRRGKTEELFQVESADFLELSEDRWLSLAPIVVVSNLPYSSGTAILDRLARHPGQIQAMVLMFQAEVAQRLRAMPDTKAWGSLSVWLQNDWDISRLLAVPPRAFVPVPQVNSEVVVMIPRVTPHVAVPRTPSAQKLWEGLLKSCFAHRRKMLRSGLPAGSAQRNALDQAGLDGTKRAEALGWSEWAAFFEALSNPAR